MKTTREQYVINGKYTIERKLLHNEIIESFLNDHSRQEQEPEAILNSRLKRLDKWKDDKIELENLEFLAKRHFREYFVEKNG